MFFKIILRIAASSVLQSILFFRQLLLEVSPVAFVYPHWDVAIRRCCTDIILGIIFQFTTSYLH